MCRQAIPGASFGAPRMGTKSPHVSKKFQILGILKVRTSLKLGATSPPSYPDEWARSKTSLVRERHSPTTQTRENCSCQSSNSLPGPCACRMRIGRTLRFRRCSWRLLLKGTTRDVYVPILTRDAGDVGGTLSRCIYQRWQTRGRR